MFRHMQIVVLAVLGIAASCEKDEKQGDEIYKTRDITIELRDWNDSRCPVDANCVWAGDVLVCLDVKSGKESAVASLNGIGADTTLYGHRIELVDVLPYPQTGVTVDSKDLTVKLNVTKL